MLNHVKRHMRTCLEFCGLDVRRVSKRVGVDPLRDLKKLRGARGFGVVIDIGANIGQSAIRFHKAFPEARIHSFEPVAASFAAGVTNTRANPAITWHHAAVGNENNRIVFYSSGTSVMNSIATTTPLSAGKDGERNEVDVIRFDDFFAANQLQRVSLLKTDTEGHDLDVLTGAKQVLAAHQVDYILCEVGFTQADTSHSFFPPIASYLEQFGYRLVCFYGISDLDHFRTWGVTYADALFALPRDHGAVAGTP